VGAQASNEGSVEPAIVHVCESVRPGGAVNGLLFGVQRLVRIQGEACYPFPNQGGLAVRVVGVPRG